MVLRVAEHWRGGGSDTQLCRWNVLCELMIMVIGNGIRQRGHSRGRCSEWRQNADRGSLDDSGGHSGSGDRSPGRRCDRGGSQRGVVGEDGTVRDGDWNQLWIESGQDRGIEVRLLGIDEWSGSRGQDGIDGDRNDGLLWDEWCHRSSRREESRSRVQSRFEECRCGHRAVVRIAWVVDIVRADGCSSMVQSVLRACVGVHVRVHRSSGGVSFINGILHDWSVVGLGRISVSSCGWQIVMQSTVVVQSTSSLNLGTI